MPSILDATELQELEKVLLFIIAAQAIWSPLIFQGNKLYPTSRPFKVLKDDASLSLEQIKIKIPRSSGGLF